MSSFYNKRNETESLKRLNRANKEPLCFLRWVNLKEKDKNDVPREYDVLGSTGFVYRVKLGKYTSCSCPDHITKHQRCKHILFILHRYLRVPTESSFRTQSQFSSSDLIQIFSYLNDYQLLHSAKQLEANEQVMKKYKDKEENINGIINKAEKTDKESENKKEKQIIQKPIDKEEECGICFESLLNGNNTSSSSSSSSNIVWCRKGCGNNLHKSCLQRWSKAIAKSEGQYTNCPLCRAEWIENDLSNDIVQIQNNKRAKHDNKQFLSSSSSSLSSSSSYINLLEN